jgi:hypothetical protein
VQLTPDGQEMGKSVTKPKERGPLGPATLLAALVQAYEDYINLLCDELNEVVPIAVNHGWVTTRKEAAKEARAKIVELKKAANDPSSPTAGGGSGGAKPKGQMKSDAEPASDCEECKKLGWPTPPGELYGINGRSLCRTHAAMEVPGIPKTTITAN